MDIAFLVMIARDACENKHTGDYLSVTGLTAPRATWLERKVDYYEEPADCWARTRGGRIHKNLQDIIALLPNFADYLLEVSFVWKIDTRIGALPINMTIDRFDKRLGILTDYKTMHDDGWRFLRNGPKEDHVTQLNCYRMGLEQNGHKVNRLATNYISMKFTREYSNVQIVPDDIILRKVPDNAATLYQAFKADSIPPVCSDEIRKWKCPKKGERGYCAAGFACPDCYLYLGGFKNGK